MAKRLLPFTFGIVTYFTFLLTTLYGIGFVGNVLVPKSIDTGNHSPFVVALLINLPLLHCLAFNIALWHAAFSSIG